MDINQPGKRLETPNPTEDCAACRVVASAIKKWPDTIDIDLGTWGGFLDRKDCNCCQTIVQLINESQRPYYEPHERSCTLVMLKFLSGYLIVSSTEDPHFHEPEDKHVRLTLVGSAAISRKKMHFVPVDPLKISLDKIRLWASTCHNDHCGYCHRNGPWQKLPSASSLTLIDVHRSCLVEFSGTLTRRYIALSYVWGEAKDVLEVTMANYSDLCIPGALQKPENRKLIPTTILDAMVLTSEMDTRFLWVDMLCIRQDDKDHMTQQLRQMASVYGNSYFTIIAASGVDARHGLRGIDGGSAPRDFKERILEFSPDVKMIVEPEDNSDLKPAVWHTRGWTFQERVVSPRTLVFIGDTVYWECRAVKCFENLARGPDDRPALKEPSREYSFDMNPWPDLKGYFGLVEKYNTRKFKYENDALNAFTSITTVMSNTFHGGFLCGIPEFLFDIGLLWSGRDALTRRAHFPSWSWVGWSGNVGVSPAYMEAWRPVSYDSNRDDNDIPEMDMGLKVRITPVFEWYKTDRSMQSLIRMKNEWHKFATHKWGPDTRLPEGWKHIDDKDRWKKGQKFEHKDIKNFGFMFPFPVSSSNRNDTAELASLLLDFDTKSCKLALGKSFRPENSPLDTIVTPVLCLHINLHDSSGNWAGIIESVFLDEAQYVQGASCELIAISKGRAKRRQKKKGNQWYIEFQPFSEMEVVDDLKGVKYYSFYNVLWIERKGSIAYRKALGRVWEEVWDHLAVQDVHISLG